MATVIPRLITDLHARARHHPHQSTDEARSATVNPCKKIAWKGDKQTDRHTDTHTDRLCDY